jgi:16S rRNA (guanine527-N7)-methyltransferase
MIDAVRFRTIVRHNGIDIPDEQLESLDEYVRRLLEWNKSINLISRRDEENIWKHIIGSISFLFRYNLARGRMLDLGTGGGLPGIPLSILHPESEFVLVDSIQKKIKAVSAVIEEMNLQNVKAVCARGEELSRNSEYRGRFDYVIARGVSEVRNVIEWSRMFLPEKRNDRNERRPTGKPDLPKGSILMLKGGDLLAEIETARVKFNPKDIDVVPLIVDGGDPADFHDKKLIIIQP